MLTYYKQNDSWRHPNSYRCDRWTVYETSNTFPKSRFISPIQLPPRKPFTRDWYVFDSSPHPNRVLIRTLVGFSSSLFFRERHVLSLEGLRSVWRTIDPIYTPSSLRRSNLTRMNRSIRCKSSTATTVRNGKLLRGLPPTWGSPVRIHG